MITNIYYNSSELKTLGDFLSNENVSIASNYIENPKDFLDYLDASGRSNFQKIINSYFGDEDLKTNAEIAYNIGNYLAIPLRPPIVFSIDSAFAKTDLYSLQGDLVQNTENVNFFISKALEQITLARTSVLNNRKFLKSDLKITHPRVTILIWCRGVNNGTLFNLSKFIYNVNFNSTESGAGFSFSLPAVKGVYGGFWKPKNSSIKQSETEYRAITSFEDKDSFTKNLFFHNVIQQNDLVFISFDDLPFNEFKQNFTVPYSEIKGKMWDCIGFVDSNSISYSKEGKADISINISGRDLTKLIIEDGSYFWATEFGFDGTIRFAGNRDNKIFRRVNSGPEGLASYFTLTNKSIEYGLRFILSQLANTGVVPNEIFESYGTRRSTIYIKDFSDDDRSLIELRGDLQSGAEFTVTRRRQLKEVSADGVWSIVKIIVDPQIANLRLVDGSLFTEQGSLINYINRLCQKPFVEFYTETIGDQFYWIARKPPHNQQAYLDAIGGVSISDPKEKFEDDLFQEIRVATSLVEVISRLDTRSLNLQFDETVYSWYKLESRYAFGGGASGIESLALLPAVFLPTYTQIYGSRPYQTSTSYVNYVPTTGVEDERNYKNAIEQAFYDLKWLIETHAYLPFTRQGSITINENRKIKKGMFVELEATGEVFLVTGVTHESSINNKLESSTTLQLTRGMVKKYIGGTNVEGISKKVSYFNLVDMPIDLKTFRRNDKGIDSKMPITNWRENVEVIDFFLKRRQFDG